MKNGWLYHLYHRKSHNDLYWLIYIITSELKLNNFLLWKVLDLLLYDLIYPKQHWGEEKKISVESLFLKGSAIWVDTLHRFLFFLLKRLRYLSKDWLALSQRLASAGEFLNQGVSKQFPYRGGISQIWPFWFAWYCGRKLVW